MKKSFENMSVEELERMLPLYVQKEVKAECPCRRCKRNREKCREKRIYKQQLSRSGTENHRVYNISYCWNWDNSDILCSTGDRFSLREVLIQAHERLMELGLHPPMMEVGGK
jgi:hypothetical protein